MKRRSDSQLQSQIQVAREVFADEYAVVHAQLAPTEATLAYRLPAELLRSMHEDLLQREAASTAAGRLRKIIIAGGSKHYSTRTLESLSWARLEQLRLGQIGRGSALLLKIISPSCRASALHFLAEDQSGWTVPVTLYHASQQLSRLCWSGAILAIREPWLKENKDGYFVRVDSPADLILWPETSWNPARMQETAQLLQEARRKGASLFARHSYEDALVVYESSLNALSKYQDRAQVPDASIILLNLGAIYLKMNMPGHAHRKLLNVDLGSLDPKQKAKWHYRNAFALFELGENKRCYEVLHSETALAEGELDDTRRDLQLRMKEAGGQFDWATLYTDLKQGRQRKINDYTGPVAIRHSHNSGKGMFTTKYIQAGELLLVANPVGISGLQGDSPGDVLGINLTSESIDTCSQVSVIGSLYDRMRDSPTIARQLEGLFAGTTFSRGADTMVDQFQPVSSEICMDAGRLEAICNYNSFRPECIATAPDDARGAREDAAEEDPMSTSAVYHLPSFINHSCLANASFIFYGAALVVRAAAPIPEGAEIFFSYCDSAASFSERQAHLARYEFSCPCRMCGEDRRLGPQQARNRDKLVKSLPGTSISNLAQTLKVIDMIDETYGPQYTSPKYHLYQAYRLLGIRLQRAGKPVREVMQTECRALACLNIRGDTDSHSNESVDLLPTQGGTPAIACLDAILSCTKIAFDLLVNEQVTPSRVWLNEAIRLHDIEFGPGIYWLRTAALFQEHGWEGLYKLR